MDKEESLPPDSVDPPDVSGDVESLLPDLPEPEVGATGPPEASTPAQDGVRATAEEPLTDEETSDPGEPAELEKAVDPAPAAKPAWCPAKMSG